MKGTEVLNPRYSAAISRVHIRHTQKSRLFEGRGNAMHWQVQFLNRSISGVGVAGDKVSALSSPAGGHRTSNLCIRITLRMRTLLIDGLGHALSSFFLP